MILFSKVSGISRLGPVGGVGEVTYPVRVNSSNSCDIYWGYHRRKNGLQKGPLHSRNLISRQVKSHHWNRLILIKTNACIICRTKDLRPEAKNFNVFFVHTVSRILICIKVASFWTGISFQTNERKQFIYSLNVFITWRITRDTPWIGSKRSKKSIAFTSEIQHNSKFVLHERRTI